MVADHQSGEYYSLVSCHAFDFPIRRRRSDLNAEDARTTSMRRPRSPNNWANNSFRRFKQSQYVSMQESWRIQGGTLKRSRALRAARRRRTVRSSMLLACLVGRQSKNAPKAFHGKNTYLSCFNVYPIDIDFLTVNAAPGIN